MSEKLNGSHETATVGFGHAPGQNGESLLPTTVHVSDMLPNGTIIANNELSFTPQLHESWVVDALQRRVEDLAVQKLGATPRKAGAINREIQGLQDRIELQNALDPSLVAAETIDVPEKNPLDEGLFMGDVFYDEKSGRVISVGSSREIGGDHLVKITGEAPTSDGKKSRFVFETTPEKAIEYVRQSGTSLLDPGHGRDPWHDRPSRTRKPATPKAPKPPTEPTPPADDPTPPPAPVLPPRQPEPHPTSPDTPNLPPRTPEPPKRKLADRLKDALRRARSKPEENAEGTSSDGSLTGSKVKEVIQYQETLRGKYLQFAEALSRKMADISPEDVKKWNGVQIAPNLRSKIFTTVNALTEAAQPYGGTIGALPDLMAWNNSNRDLEVVTKPRLVTVQDDDKVHHLVVVARKTMSDSGVEQSNLYPGNANSLPNDYDYNDERKRKERFEVSFYSLPEGYDASGGIGGLKITDLHEIDAGSRIKWSDMSMQKDRYIDYDYAESVCTTVDTVLGREHTPLPAPPEGLPRSLEVPYRLLSPFRRWSKNAMRQALMMEAIRQQGTRRTNEDNVEDETNEEN